MNSYIVQNNSQFQNIKSDNNRISNVPLIQQQVTQNQVPQQKDTIIDKFFGFFTNKDKNNYNVVEQFENNSNIQVISQSLDLKTNHLNLLCKINKSFYIEIIDLQTQNKSKLIISSTSDMLLNINQFGSPSNYHVVIIGSNNIYFLNVNQKMEESKIFVELDTQQIQNNGQKRPYKIIRNYRYTNFQITFDNNFYIYYSQSSRKIEYQRCYQQEKKSFRVGHDFNQIEASKFTDAILCYDSTGRSDSITVLELANGYYQKIKIKKQIYRQQENYKHEFQNQMQAKFFDNDNKIIVVQGYLIGYYINRSYVQQAQQDKLLNMDYQQCNQINLYDAIPDLTNNDVVFDLETSCDREYFYIISVNRFKTESAAKSYRVHFKNNEIQRECNYYFNDESSGVYITRLGKHSTAYNGFNDVQMMIFVKKQNIDESRPKYQLAYGTI